MNKLKTQLLDNHMYQMFFKLMFLIVIQNMLTFSVNVADNIMLGGYNQIALSGAATVNQIQFLLQQITMGLGEGLVTLSSQYWGQKKLKPIYELTSIVLCIGICVGIALTAAAFCFPTQILQVFTGDPDIIEQGARYLNIMKFTYIPFIISTLLLAYLRSMETVKLGFYISCITLILNISINYMFIFGKLGAPELGITGAAIGTLAARIVELIIIIVYIKQKHSALWAINIRYTTKKLWNQYIKISLPIVITQALFGLSISLQTAVIGHLSSEAIAANSAATTIFQYLKIIALGSSSATVVLIGKTIGSGSMTNLKKYKQNLQFIYLIIGLIICGLLNLIKYPLIGLYALTPSTKELAIQIITLLSITSIGTSYQMPVNTGIIRASGNTSFVLKLDLVSIWGIVYPLSIAAAFVWKLPVIAVIACLNSDQIFKCIPAYLKVNKFFSVHMLNEV